MKRRAQDWRGGLSRVFVLAVIGLVGVVVLFAQGCASAHTGAVPTLPSGSTKHVAATLPVTVDTVVSARLPATLPVSAEPFMVPILMYHYVDFSSPPAGPYAAGLTVPTAQFGAEMDYLARNGYHPVLLEQVYAAMAGLQTLLAKPVALTFDDGGRDDFTASYGRITSLPLSSSLRALWAGPSA